jgi:hypothetical protein
MNKYEQLMDYIINEQEDKAKALFHDIVVERSREIYESMMDEQDPAVSDDQVEGLVDEITADETGMHEQDNEDDLGIEGDDMGVADAGDDMGMDGDDMGMDGDIDAGGEGEIEDRVMDLEDAIDELKAEFDRLMGTVDTDGDGDHDMGDHGDDEVGNMDDTEDDMQKVSESADEDEDDEEDKKDKKDAKKSEAEKLREYVDKVSDGHGAEKKGSAEGHEVGKAGSSVGLNKQSIVAGKNDMGGTASNLVKGGTENAPDGTSPKAAVKAKGEFTGQFQNKPGARADMGKAPVAKKGEGQTTNGTVPTNKRSIEPGSK